MIDRVIGNFKVALHQSAFLFSLYNLGMLAYLFVAKRGGLLWWDLLFPLGLVIWNVIFFKWVRGSEIKSNREADELFMEMYNDIKELRKENAKLRTNYLPERQAEYLRIDTEI